MMNDESRWMVNLIKSWKATGNDFDYALWDLIADANHDSNAKGRSARSVLNFIIELVHHIRDLETENIALRDNLSKMLKSFEAEISQVSRLKDENEQLRTFRAGEHNDQTVYDNITEAVRQPVDNEPEWFYNQQTGVFGIETEKSAENKTERKPINVSRVWRRYFDGFDEGWYDELEI